MRFCIAKQGESFFELYSSLGEKLYDSVRKNVFMDLISPLVDQREGSVYV